MDSMYRRIFLFTFTVVLFFLVSCVNEEGLDAFEEGIGSIDVELRSMTSTRATSKPLSAEEAENFLITIYRGEEPVHETMLLKNLGNASFPAGSGYRVHAENCTEEEAESANNGWGQRHYAGKSTAFSIRASETTKVEVNCSVVNSGISVNFNEDIQNTYNNYSLTISDGNRIIIFDKERQGDIAYFNVSDNGEHTINYSIHAEGEGVETIDKSGTKTLEKAKVSRINIKHSTTGTIGLTILVDEEFIEKEEEITIDPEDNE